MLDFQTIFLNIFSAIPWWFYPLTILIMYIKIKVKQWEKNLKNKNKKHKTDKEYKPINTINSDRGSLYNTINNEKRKPNTNTKEKGEKYEAFICEKYKLLGYTIAPHGKDNGVKDQGIDVIAKKNKEILFIQCKDWNTKSGYKINHKEIQYVRMNVRDYLEKNVMFKDYNWKIVYATSEDILDRSAKYKIRENSHEIEHRVIPI